MTLQVQQEVTVEGRLLQVVRNQYLKDDQEHITQVQIFHRSKKNNVKKTFWTIDLDYTFKTINMYFIRKIENATNSTFEHASIFRSQTENHNEIYLFFYPKRGGLRF